MLVFACGYGLTVDVTAVDRISAAENAEVQQPGEMVCGNERYGRSCAHRGRCKILEGRRKRSEAIPGCGGLGAFKGKRSSAYRD